MAASLETEVILARRLDCDDRDAFVFKYPADQVNGYCSPPTESCGFCAPPLVIDRGLTITTTDRSNGLDSRGCQQASPQSVAWLLLGLAGFWLKGHNANRTTRTETGGA